MRVFRSFAIGALVIGCAGVGFAWRDIQSGHAPDRGAVNRLLGVRTTSGLTPDRVFRQAYQQINNGYVHKVSATDLKYAGMQGLVASLGDPHTIFMPPKLAQLFSEDTSGNFFGVGARLQPDPLGAKAASVFEDGPAYAAGLRKNDLITMVNGKKVAGIAIDAIVDQIKGKEGSYVLLTIARPKVNKPVQLKIRRARIQTPTVERAFFEKEDVGYLSISQVAEPTAEQFDRELTKLETQGIKGLVIDLRGNPGGLLDTTREMLSRFVENKVVVKMRLRGGEEEEVRTYSGMVKDQNYPIAILIDENTASAAEIFAGCLRDYGRATLVGTHSYGKASVQNLFPLTDAASAKVTIAKYFLPSGKDIGRKVDSDGVFVSGGLRPDIEVELDPNVDPLPQDPKTDRQLGRAVDFVVGHSTKVGWNLSPPAFFSSWTRDC
ncbi:carboxy-terminal processing protease CtpB [soil metagenome]